MGMLIAAIFFYMMSFCPVTPEFMRLNCVQQVSISTRISLTAYKLF